MTHDRALKPAQTYLAALERALADHPGTQRETILEDVRAHIAESLDAGHSIEHVLDRLGTPASVAATAAAERSGEHPDQSRDTATAAERARTTLLAAAAAVGVLTAAVVSFLLPVYQTASVTIDPDTSATERVEDAVTLVEQAGFAAVLLALVPVVFAALPLLLPQRMRAGFALTGAIAVTLFTIIGAATLGAFYLPLAMLLWAAVIAPLAIRRGPRRTAARVWRVVGAAVLALPALALAAGLASGAIGADPAPVAWAVLALVLAALLAVGAHLAPVLVTAVGAALMVLAIIDAGMLFLAVWIAGGVYLTIGLVAWVAARARVGTAHATGAASA